MPIKEEINWRVLLKKIAERRVLYANRDLPNRFREQITADKHGHEPYP
ncbi:hypothetical protein BROSI_A1221 [Candidatus Brocadia sinica JPN1]|uniref:Uncharacterized protein n=1 Tax=Candidatus Brocadia sinica JPN1 TaxID=1197129 RepID=A0ABQ0JVJ1_9BACT|nr:hypothetical protein BROSI_A1221 [Candidatus Brocadia sinica JPN1]